MMSEKRFIVENERTVYDNLFHRGYVCSWKIDAQELVGLLNEQQATIRKLQDLCGESDGENAKLRIENKEQQATINLLLDLLYQSEETVINEYSSHIGEDMDKLDKIFEEKDIKEIERFVRGCDDE